MLDYLLPRYKVLRDRDECVQCGVCERSCANGVHKVDEDLGRVTADHAKCVNCQRCVVMCPTTAIAITRWPQVDAGSGNWTLEAMQDIAKQAQTGAVLLASMGNPKDYPIYWDHLLLNASQVTNPSIDPLREPMETRVFLGSRPGMLKVNEREHVVMTPMPPQIRLDVPLMFSAMSFGSVSLNAQKSLAMAAKELGTYFNTGEGGLHRDLEAYADHAIVQVASGRFGVDPHYLNAGAAIEIKIGQGAKPGIGGHLPGEKINEEVSRTRMIPQGTDAISPAPHHDIYSIEDLRQLIFSLKEATLYRKPVAVKIAAVHNVAAIASGMARAGADIIVVDGFRGGTGAAPKRIRDNVGIPIELALAAVDQRLRDEGIRSTVSLVAAGSVRSSADVVRAIALGADAAYIASAALIALGCHQCQDCSSGRCNWGIATQNPDLTKRLNPEVAAERVVNLVRGWNHEIKEMMGGMGINAIDSLRGNRLMLRGIGLNDKELEILGVKYAGE
ncbi:glutamate synthase-related protein [Adlercreutzia faecimuris]|uniref:glutamate synthase (NADPH) n=1 Tax=Adlercreutzia faecimuris TaxID=2897341 RepID=A0ABS9WJB2_9ACTN|nr:glutamate synthase-related protein [Adlercreutzia sp. JBNU-10]MCI2242969.1 FMN-binding glutamate synthase family protein [Adlercreutzia sp. JBNU-10]